MARQYLTDSVCSLTHLSRYTAVDDDLTTFPGHHVRQYGAGQGQTGQHVQFKHLAVNLDINLVPLGSLGATSVIHQNINLRAKQGNITASCKRVLIAINFLCTDTMN